MAQPSDWTLIQMFGDDTPIGDFSEKYFEEHYDPNAPLNDRMQNIIDYAVSVHGEEESYWWVSPYGGEDITVHTIAELAISKSMEKGFTPEEIVTLRKELLKGGYLKDDIKEYSQKYCDACNQLNGLRQEYLKFEAQSFSLMEQYKTMSEKSNEIFFKMQDQQMRHDDAKDRLDKLSFFGWLLHPLKSAAEKSFATNELRSADKVLLNLERQYQECEARLNEWKVMQNDHFANEPYGQIREDEWEPISSLHEVEAAEDFARQVIADCKEFFAQYGLPEPKTTEASTSSMEDTVEPSNDTAGIYEQAFSAAQAAPASMEIEELEM